MGRILMMSGYNNVQLKGLDLFVYLMKRFGNTPEQALETMKEHNQDTTAVEQAIAMAKKQEGKSNETND